MGSDFCSNFVLLWQGIAMPVIIFLAGFQSIPQEIIEAARMDGANDKQIFGILKSPTYYQVFQWYLLWH